MQLAFTGVHYLLYLYKCFQPFFAYLDSRYKLRQFDCLLLAEHAEAKLSGGG